MITNSTEENNFPSSKLEANTSDGKTNKGSSSSSATPWLRLKDPRIVRVSRAFGGKDRHSKVCTIRGLRDRRVRLSVPTAIQLYDLQDRLGLNQPSKVVDWLLNAAKDEIDELPPLPIPSGDLGLNYQSILAHNSNESASHPHQQTNEFKTNNNVVDWEASSRSKFPVSDTFLRSKSKEDWTDRTNENQERRGKNGLEQKQVLANNTGPHPSSFSSLLNNVSSLVGYYCEPSSSHQMGSHGFITSQGAEDHVHSYNNFMSLPSPLSLSTGSQIFLSPQGLTQSLEIDPRHQANHLQMLNSNSQNFSLHNSLHSINQSMRPFHFSMAPKFVAPEKNNGDHDQPNKNFASDN